MYVLVHILIGDVTNNRQAYAPTKQPVETGGKVLTNCVVIALTMVKDVILDEKDLRSGGHVPIFSLFSFNLLAYFWRRARLRE